MDKEKKLSEMTTTELLYNVTKKELDSMLYKTILETQSSNEEGNLNDSDMSVLVQDAVIGKRISLLKNNRHRILTSQSIIELTKEKDVQLDKIIKAVDFWRKVMLEEN